MSYLSNESKEFAIAHELAHRQNKHKPVFLVSISIIHIGVFKTMASVRKYFTGRVLGGAALVFIIGQRFQQILEKHADLVAADKVGTQGGISMFSSDLDGSFQNVKKSIFSNFFTNFNNMISSHPSDKERVNYLKAFEKDPHSCWWYNLIREKK